MTIAANIDDLIFRIETDIDWDKDFSLCLDILRLLADEDIILLDSHPIHDRSEHDKELVRILERIRDEHSQS